MFCFAVTIRHYARHWNRRLPLPIPGRASGFQLHFRFIPWLMVILFVVVWVDAIQQKVWKLTQ